jgi:hypothetical protein
MAMKENMIGKLCTYKGRIIDLRNMEPEDFDVVEIAHALSLRCRFGGMSKEFYSVGQHSFYASWMVPAKKALAALLHDGVEAYLGDMVSPLKPLFPEFKTFEKKLGGQMALSFSLAVDALEDPDIKMVDQKLMALEAAYLMTDPSFVFDYVGTPDGSMFMIDRSFHCWEPKIAEDIFMQRFNELKDGGHIA